MSKLGVRRPRKKYRTGEKNIQDTNPLTQEKLKVENTTLTISCRFAVGGIAPFCRGAVPVTSIPMNPRKKK